MYLPREHSKFKEVFFSADSATPHGGEAKGFRATNNDSIRKAKANTHRAVTHT